MECSVCFVDTALTVRDSLHTLFACKCLHAQLCASCATRLSSCPWCRAAKRAVSLQVAVQRQSLTFAVVVRKRFYDVLKLVHTKVVHREAANVANLLAQCWQFVTESADCFVAKEVYCLEDCSKGVDALINGKQLPPHSCCIYERVLNKLYEFRHQAEDPVATICTSCRFVQTVYGSSYVSLSCTLCAI